MQRRGSLDSEAFWDFATRTVKVASDHDSANQISVIPGAYRVLKEKGHVTACVPS